MTGVKRVMWNANNSMLAVMAANAVRILTKDLKQCCVVMEKRRVKDCIWDDRGALLYSTLSQIKYLLPSGENGIVRSLDEPVYLVCLRGSTLYVFNRESAIIKIEIDATEYLFKLSLENHRYHDAIKIIRNNKVDSQAIIGYLQRNGFEDIALYFVTEPRAKFNLALRCGKLETAEECANELNEPAIWNLLADEALRQGNWKIVEECYVRTKAFDKLSFFYIITGNQEKLRKMMKVAEVRGDRMSYYFNAMYLGDVEARVKALRDAGQLSLAYVTAVTYGLTDAAEEVQALLQQQSLPIPEISPVAMEDLLTPPSPTPGAVENLPLLDMARTTFDRVMEEEVNQPPTRTAEEAVEEEFQSVEEEQHTWDDDDLGLSEEDATGWGDDLDFSEDEPLPVAEATEQEVPQAASDVISQWCQNSSLAYDHAAAGNVDSACQLLNRQIGAVGMTSLTPVLRSAFLSVQSVSAGFPGMPPLSTPLLRSASPKALPLAVFRLQHATQLVKLGLKCFQSGRFEDTLNTFRSMLQILPLIVVESREEEVSLKQALEMAREYIIAVQIELARKEVPQGSVRSLSLAAFMTHCQLQSPHMLLALNSAMVAAFKAENFIEAAGFANRILANSEIRSPRNAALEQKTRKVLVRSEREGRNAIETGYDAQRPFIMDCKTLTPIYKGEDSVKCPYCGASYRPESMKSLCSVCGLAQVGLETVGLVCMNSHK